MKTSPNSHFANLIATILKRYRCTESEKQWLSTLSIDQIIQISQTEFGGFDKVTGQFNPEIKSGTYKVKIDYNDMNEGRCKREYLVSNHIN